jgi:hypothetical protein
MSKRRQQSLKSSKPVKYQKIRASKDSDLPQKLSADTLPSDVRPGKVAKARKLIARPDYPSKRVIQSVADKIARYF